MKIKQQKQIKTFLTEEYGSEKGSALFDWQTEILDELIKNTRGKSENQMKTLTETILPRVALYKALSKEDFPQKIYTKMLCGIQMNTISRTLYRRELFDGVRFDTTMKTGEDLLCGMEIYTRARSFCYVDDVIYHYCPDGSGLTGSSLAVLEKYRCNMKLSRALLGYLKKWNMDCVKNRCLAIFRLVRITIQKLKSNNDF